MMILLHALFWFDMTIQVMLMLIFLLLLMTMMILVLLYSVLIRRTDQSRKRV